MMKSDEMSPVATSATGASAKRAFSIAEFCESYGICRTKAYEEFKAGRLRIVKVGRRSLIRETDAESWLAALPSLKNVGMSRDSH
jgi:excisionase family DNA binding protein